MSGYRTSRHFVLLTFHDVFQLLESGADVSLAFFDLCKAFHTIPHLPLLQKLSGCGLDQNILMDYILLLATTV